MNTQHTALSSDKVFTVPEVAAYLKISKLKIYCRVACRDSLPDLHRNDFLLGFGHKPEFLTVVPTS